MRDWISRRSGRPTVADAPSTCSGAALADASIWALARSAWRVLRSTAAGFGWLARLSFSALVAYRPSVPSIASASSSTRSRRLPNNPPGATNADSTAFTPAPTVPESSSRRERDTRPRPAASPRPVPPPRPTPLPRP
eukprot:scaffold9982_cov95-Isochrysis_galbana.AAC.3